MRTPVMRAATLRGIGSCTLVMVLVSLLIAGIVYTLHHSKSLEQLPGLTRRYEEVA